MEAAAEVVVAQEALLALAATLAGGEEHAPAGLDALAELAGLDDFAGHIAAQDVRHGELHAGDAGADEEIEMVSAQARTRTRIWSALILGSGVSS
jgi:hypothetical protein